MRGWHSVCGEECPCSQETPAGVFMNEALWCFQLTWSGAEKKWGREKANVEPRLRVYGYDLTVLFFTFYIDLNTFKRKIRDKSRVGKISLQKMWSPVSAHFLLPTLPAFSVFCCLIWYIPPNVKINADTAAFGSTILDLSNTFLG